MRTTQYLFCLIAFSACWPAVAHAQQENPVYTSWRNFEPGTTVTMRTVTRQSGTVISETKQTQTLVEKTDDHIAVEIGSIIIAAGQEIESGKTTMTFQRAITAAETGEAPAETSSDVQLTRGEESIEINGEKFACQWVQTEMEFNGNNTTSRIWTSTQVPGLNVKLVVTSAGTVAETTLLGIDKP